MPETTKAYPQPTAWGRALTAQERSLWGRAKQKMEQTDRNLLVARNYLENCIVAAKFAQSHGITIPAFTSTGLPATASVADEEQRFLNTWFDFKAMRDSMRGVEDQEFALRPSGNDLDIVEVDHSLGAALVILAAVAGGVIVAGIVARWIYLESQSEEIKDDFNNLMAEADEALCVNPDSEQCQQWEDTKQEQKFYKRKTISDTVQSAVSVAGKGLGMGLLIAIPLLAYSWFGNKRS